MFNVTITLQTVACARTEDDYPETDEFYVRFKLAEKGHAQQTQWKETQRYDMEPNQVRHLDLPLLSNAPIDPQKAYEFHIEAWDEDAGVYAHDIEEGEKRLGELAEGLEKIPAIGPLAGGGVRIAQGILGIIGWVVSLDPDDLLGERMTPIKAPPLIFMEDRMQIPSPLDQPLPHVLRANRHGADYMVIYTVRYAY